MGDTAALACTAPIARPHTATTGTPKWPLRPFDASRAPASTLEMVLFRVVSTHSAVVLGTFSAWLPGPTPLPPSIRWETVFGPQCGLLTVSLRFAAPLYGSYYEQTTSPLTPNSVRCTIANQAYLSLPLLSATTTSTPLYVRPR